jgi:hypothetical protein
VDPVPEHCYSENLAALGIEPRTSCGIYHINTKNTKNVYSFTEALTQDNPRINSIF